MEKPNEHELQNAAEICQALMDYIVDTQPHAVRDIEVLEEAMNILDAFTEFPDE